MSFGGETKAAKSHQGSGIKGREERSREGLTVKIC